MQENIFYIRRGDKTPEWLATFCVKRLMTAPTLVGHVLLPTLQQDKVTEADQNEIMETLKAMLVGALLVSESSDYAKEHNSPYSDPHHSDWSWGRGQLKVAVVSAKEIMEFAATSREFSTAFPGIRLPSYDQQVFIAAL